ncbi:MAG: hypothetical protein A2289_22600 [Deltaproteobacteria bacterium RIFOXYA12_FULL_58_15]|nr:MAG: hypothetical protein A2289_22600 [Deltaproteobacteria bacterium RIFOXYA12_FULL_58_15]OGR08815.1 MAG: hypothetical protein A2341_10420 [Deltaproteobacteria bacterium RIFOXYB12_FULL_58_9]
MGGLVARSAAHYAEEAKYTSVGLLTRMFLIGVPLRGSSVEQLFHIAAWNTRDADALSFGRRYKVPLAKGVAHYVIARVFRGLGHLAIVIDDAVYQQIITWWHEQSELP